MSTYRGAFSSDNMDALGGAPTPDVGGARYARQTKLPKDQNSTRRNFSDGGVADAGWDIDGYPVPLAETDPPWKRIDSPGDRGFGSSDLGPLAPTNKAQKPGRP